MFLLKLKSDAVKHVMDLVTLMKSHLPDKPIGLHCTDLGRKHLVLKDWFKPNGIFWSLPSLTVCDPAMAKLSLGSYPWPKAISNASQRKKPSPRRAILDKRLKVRVWLWA